jgi:general secretion pathway protein D
MRTSFARIAAAAVCAACAFALTPAAIAQEAGATQKFDVNIRDADMKSAIDFLQKLTGLSIVFKASDQEYKPVTVALREVSAEDALKNICLSAGAYWTRDLSGIYIISQDKPETPKVNLGSDSLPPIKEVAKLRAIQLQHADAEAVYKQITTGYVMDPMHGYREINRMKEFGVINDFRPQTSIYNSSGAPMSGLEITPRNTTQPVPKTGEGSNNILLPGESAPQGSLGGGFGGGQGGNAPGGGGQGQGQGGGQLGTGGLIDPGIDFITFDPNTNQILIRATEDQWRTLQGYIDQFDVVPKQVTIKVQFVTTSSSNSRSLGFDWLYTRGPQVIGNVPGSFARSGDPIFLSWASGNFQARLRTFLQDGYGSTVSSPIVRTLNNQPAFVQQALQTVIFIPTTFNNGQISTTVYTPFPLVAQSTLAVRPRINADGTVTMALNMPIQQFGQIRRSPDGSFAVPDLSTQQISIVSRVRSGETIVLAGFTQKNDTVTQQKFPVLGDLPIIGQFFRSSTKDVNNTELLVFVTPVIEDPETSGGFGG